MTRGYDSFFDRHAPDWDRRQTPETFEKIKVILARLAVGPGDAVLDVGCGTGILFPFLRGLGVAEYAGIDCSEGMTREFSHKFTRTNILTADFQIAGLFKNSSFSKIIIFNSFPHFSRRQAVFENSFAALKPGGKLCIAHSTTRDELAAIHEKAGPEVAAHILPPDDRLLALYSKAGFVDTQLSDSGYFYSEGQKP